jgi:monoamine oxidase
MVQNPDVIIIGAGAAGVGPGLALTRLGLSHLIPEAKHRVGGRAYSETSSIGHPWYPMIRHWCQLMYAVDPEDTRREMLEITPIVASIYQCRQIMAR